MTVSEMSLQNTTISRVMARRYKKEVDPWIEYQSVMK
jgi:hypothetical protein